MTSKIGKKLTLSLLLLAAMSGGAIQLQAATQPQTAPNLTRAVQVATTLTDTGLAKAKVDGKAALAKVQNQLSECSTAAQMADKQLNYLNAAAKQGPAKYADANAALGKAYGYPATNPPADLLPRFKEDSVAAHAKLEIIGGAFNQLNIALNGPSPSSAKINAAIANGEAAIIKVRPPVIAPTGLNTTKAPALLQN